jgi:hypothetical protein
MDLKATPYIPSEKKSMSNLLDTNTMTPEDIESRLSELYNTKLSGNVKEQIEFTSMSQTQEIEDNEHQHFIHMKMILKNKLLNLII